MQDGRAPQIKNRAPAAIQHVEDLEELHDYRDCKRKEFEKRIRQTQGSINEWLQYANWEAIQGERALDIDPLSVQLWLGYTEMELKGRNVQCARNLFDRAVTLLPHVDQLWLRYVYLEELLQGAPGAWQVFERCLQSEPDDKAWQAYIEMEQRYGEHDRASAIYEQWIAVHPKPQVWIKWAKFEEERGKLDKVREVFQTALEFFRNGAEQVEKVQAVFNAFAKMETRLKEYERVCVIYKFALSRLPRSKSQALFAAYTKFEKQHGSNTTLESVRELLRDGRNYNVWFDYARLEEGVLRVLRDEGANPEEEERAIERVREVYERAVARRYWQQYIFLWLFYTLFEETETRDYSWARQIYQAAISLVPHKRFMFAKLWLMFASFEVHCLQLPAARKILGTAIGSCPKEALFKGYIQLEIDYDPRNSAAWLRYAELESQLEDIARARAIFDLGISQPQLSTPEVLWKAYIDFEIEEGEQAKGWVAEPAPALSVLDASSDCS
ncbi:hypothetical protein CERSUDRAFT_65926 [Gelatoporia subvermispora B]|uniref:Suppressor of forked domain-containing protein n=1 Tax=Ceriporiopsis subvermispora (strain B) TaxID=914234 RepID=M2PJ24_CERS8|nr:hypothetical protein CERSUDRAFT_65926 [Gelatoporia subvermispora B]